MNEEILKAIKDEIGLCYEAIGRKAPESAPIIAASIQDALHFSNLQQVHEIFKRAKDIESIPTQKTLKESLKNYGEEWLKYDGENQDAKALEYSDTRAAWLPKEDIKRRINLMDAIKNYCSAIGDGMAFHYMQTHLTRTEKRGDRRVVLWENPDKVAAFDEPIKEYLRYLYTKYWRSLPQCQGFPEGAKLNLGLTPPTIEQFRIMLKAEGQLR